MISVKDLKGVDLFEGLTAKDLQQFVRHFTEKIFKKGERIFSQERPAQNLYILLEGKVNLGVQTKGKIDITTYSVTKRGQAFGLSCLNKPYRNNVSATCYEKARVLSIKGEAIRELMRQNSIAGLRIMERVAEIYFDIISRLVKKIS